MIKKLLSAIITALLLASCSNETSVEKAISVSLSNISTKSADYVAKRISLEGTVVHVCKHGGKKMFIIGENPEKRFKVTAGPDIGSFDIKLEGSDVRVVGLLEEERVDETYLNNRESEINKNHKVEMKHEEQSSEEGEEQYGQELKQIESLRKKLAQSGKEHLSFYSLKCESFTEI